MASRRRASSGPGVECDSRRKPGVCSGNPESTKSFQELIEAIDHLIRPIDRVGELGLDSRRETIEMDELPAPIRKLTPREAEDFLCVYKDDLSRP